MIDIALHLREREENCDFTLLLRHGSGLVMDVGCCARSCLSYWLKRREESWLAKRSIGSNEQPFFAQATEDLLANSSTIAVI